MKNLIIFFLLVSSAVFSQNYHYALDEAPADPDTENPTAPQNLVASNITQNSVNLTWTAATDNVGVVNYILYNNGEVLIPSTGNVTNYLLNSLTANTVYNITVRSIDGANNISNDSNIASFTTLELLGVSNMLEEIDFFSATLCPISDASRLQYYLDTYGSVRLEAGDYGYNGAPINMETGMRLYGHPSNTLIPDINVGASGNGSNGIVITDVTPISLSFMTGGVHRNNILKSIGNGYQNINSTGGRLEDNLFININGQILYDFSTSGYARNNRVYRHTLSTLSPQLVMTGNSTTPSYGNIHAWNAFLTPNGDAVRLDNMGDITFLGIDSEGWNIRDQQTVDAMFYARNMGDVVITDMGGANGYCGGCETKPWDVQADNLLFFNKGIGNADWSNSSVARSNTNVAVIKTNSKKEEYSLEAGTGTNLETMVSGNTDETLNYKITYNKTVRTATLTDPTEIADIKSQLIKPKRTPYPRSYHEPVPDPLGPNWEANRIGQPDSHDYIQGLIDANKVAELPEGIYYIGSTLNLYGDVVQDNRQGIVGKGTGKTVICGLTDDFPLITLRKNESTFSLNISQFQFAYLTLQGGSTGIYSPDEIGQIAFVNWKYITFRNQNKGFRLYHNFGLDNTFIDHWNFVNCTVGISQESPTTYTFNDASYVDKTVFYKCQWINNEQAMDLTGIRANNLNTWIDCNFDGNGMVAEIGGNNYPTFINCDFTNNTGGGYSGPNGELINFGEASFYSCDFSGNTSESIFNLQTLFAEGCNFLDNIPLMRNQHINQQQHIYNCTVNSSSLGGGLRNNSGVFINNNFTQIPELNKLFVHMDRGDEATSNDNSIITIIDEPSNPYPQFLVKH